MNKLQTPDDIDDFFDDVEEIEVFVLKYLDRSKYGKKSSECCLALLNLATSAHICSGGDIKHFIKMANASYKDSQQLIDYVDEEDRSNERQS